MKYKTVKVKKFLVVYAAIFSVCYSVMPFICIAAYAKRGYFDIGGEWLIPIAVIAVLEVIRVAVANLTKIKEKKGSL